MKSSGMDQVLKDENDMVDIDQTKAPQNQYVVPRLTTQSLEALQSDEQRRLMDLVDNLRRAGLSSVLQLPQIVVCGDQSSGKSSVLEAITEIPFPQKENLCTRFATEISLRKGAVHRVSCKISPDEGRTEEEKQRLNGFVKTIEDFEALPDLIDEVTNLMGLDSSKAFSRDVLCIEICGPDRPQLTLIDLPGLIHSSNRTQSDEDVELIKSLVQDYISKERTIILAVISAKNDYANQIILKMCRIFDEGGSRTLGIITKPDFLRPNSENESLWLDLARNRDISFELGWHLLRNRADDERSSSFAQRNSTERLFFSTGNYVSLPAYMMGVDTLRRRLSSLLFNHLKKGLPDLRAELFGKLAETAESLQALGKSRESLSDQRVYLAELATSASTIIQMGVNGVYDASFFGKIDVDKAVNEDNNARRLRAVVQQLNIRFSERMRLCGHAYTVDHDADLRDNSGTADSKLKVIKFSKKSARLSREQAVEQVTMIQERIRGRELPGVSNPAIIGHLFAEQSAKWDIIARTHIDAVAEACKQFVLDVLDNVACPSVRERLYSNTVGPALRKAHAASTEELKLIFEDKKRHPITYNHYFTDTLQKKQRDRYVQQLKKASDGAVVVVAQKTFTGGPGFEDRQYIDPVTLQSELQRSIQPDMERFGAEQAIDIHDAYYKDEQKYFIAVVTKQAVERRLVNPLISILSPRTLAAYTDHEVQSVAKESEDVVQLRAHLQNKKKILEHGQQAFDATVGHDA